MRWTKILEDINNTTPRIAAKLSLGDGNKKARRSSLSSFREFLDLENPVRQCSVCNEAIQESELSIDHVIPWSFLYSDDLWNLLYAHKRCNSSKSNFPPDKKKIKFLNERNNRLLTLIEAQRTDLTTKKNYTALKSAIDENLVYKMWTVYRGY